MEEDLDNFLSKFHFANVDLRTILAEHDLLETVEAVSADGDGIQLVNGTSMREPLLFYVTESELSPCLSSLSLGQRKLFFLELVKWRNAWRTKHNIQMSPAHHRSPESSTDASSSEDERSTQKETNVLSRKPSNASKHSSRNVVPNGAASFVICPNCLQRSRFGLASSLEPERWKSVIAFLYLLIVSWLTAFVMVIVHDRVPDMEKYPPLPDLFLDNLPVIPWAFEMCELTGMILLVLWILVLVFHKHRFILMRRFFSISGTIFLLRCVTMLITSLSVPGKHLSCAPRPYGDIWNKLYNAYMIWTGAGLTLQGVRTCGDYMFSGHTVSLTLLNFFITEYTSRRIYFLHTFTWICNVFGVFFILAAHEHYSIDVFVAFYISSRLFLYYHTLANNKGSGKVGQRSWFYFPLFYFFESKIEGKIPNEFALPLTYFDLQNGFNKVKSFYMTLNLQKVQDDPKNYSKSALPSESKKQD